MPQENIILQPEQEKVLKLPERGAILVKGVAGSGKTTIALHRAKYLLDNFAHLFDHNRIAIFTYNRLLSNYLESIRHGITQYYGSDSAAQTSNTPLHAYITNFHKWAYQYMLNYGDKRCKRTIQGKEQENIFKGIMSENPTWDISHKQLSFLQEEISWIKGKCITSLQEYQGISRAGRGTSERISQRQRVEIWQLYEAYTYALTLRKSIDFDDYAQVTHDLISRDAYFVPPYTHIVIDEAQDLTKAQLLTIKKLISPETESITIIADSAQRIYKSGFTWAEAGFTFKGKTCVLKRNYRSTINISRAALSLLDNDPQKAEFTAIESARRGEHVPTFYKGRSFEEQWDFLNARLPHLLAQEYSVVLLLKNRMLLKEFAQLLRLHKYMPQILSKASRLPDSRKGLFLCTMQTVKGLEFDIVFILNCNDTPIPYIAQQGEQDQEYLSTERRKLFTAMTRAREQLYIVSSEAKHSALLDEIDSEYINIISPNT